ALTVDLDLDGLALRDQRRDELCDIAVRRIDLWCVSHWSDYFFPGRACGIRKIHRSIRRTPPCPERREPRLWLTSRSVGGWSDRVGRDGATGFHGAALSGDGGGVADGPVLHL